jgi:tetrahydromethanopterin S-methyltransferase subunit B
MGILQNQFSFSSITSLLGSVAESILPGSTNEKTLIGSTIGTSDDLTHALSDGSAGDGVQSTNDNVVAPGGEFQNLFAGAGLGIENTLSEHLPAVDSLPGVSTISTGLDPVGESVEQLNGTVVDLADNISPGASSPHTTLGDVIGVSGIVPDLVSNLHDGSPSGAILDVYKDTLLHGGIVNNVGDGYGTGLESLVHQLNGAEGTVPAVDVVPSVLGDLPANVADTLDGVSPGATSPDTLTGNIVGQSGVVDDVTSNMSQGSLTGGVVSAYDDVFAKGGAVNNLAYGHGVGTESLVSQISSLANGVGLSDGAGQDASHADLGQVGALLGGGSEVSTVTDLIGHSDTLGNLLGDHDLSGALDSIHHVLGS